MWILAFIAYKRPRLAANIVLVWLAVMGFCAGIAGLGRLFLRAAGETLPYIDSAALDMAAMVVGPLVVLAVFVYMSERKPARPRA